MAVLRGNQAILKKTRRERHKMSFNYVDLLLLSNASGFNTYPTPPLIRNFASFRSISLPRTCILRETENN